MRRLSFIKNGRTQPLCQTADKAAVTHLAGLRIALLMTCLLVAPIAAAEAVLNIYNWADYIGKTTIKDFETEFGIDVNYDVYDTSEMVDAKMMAGKSGYDLVIHSGAFSSRLMPAGIYSRLDWERLANRDNLDPRLLASFGQFDPGNLHGMPYMWGTTGFSYNREMLLDRMPDAPLDSAEMVFNPTILARFADCGVSLLDSSSDVIPMVMSYLGYPSTSINPSHLKEAEAALKAIRPYIRYFSSTKMLLDLPAKEVCIAQSWSGDYSVAAKRAREAGIDIDLGYNIPKEGSLIWFDAWFIPSDAPHRDNAYLFLNYLLRPEVIAAISNFTGYANANRKARPLVDPALTGNPAIYPDEAVIARLSPGKIYPPKQERARTRVWTRLKSGL